MSGETRIARTIPKYIKDEVRGILLKSKHTEQEADIFIEAIEDLSIGRIDESRAIDDLAKICGTKEMAEEVLKLANVA